jgi:hypothetical protein
MDVLGIECDIIHSTEEGEHAWNIVKIDGDWYHVDLTFDEGDKEPSYSRLNVTDDVKELDGYPWNPEDFHECTVTKYNYGVQNAVDCEDVYAIPALLKKALDDGQETVYLKIPVPDGADATVFAGQLNCIADNQESERYVMYCSFPMIIDDGKALVAGFSVYDYDEGDYSSYEDVSADRADIDYSKVRKAFEKAFDGELSISEDAEDYENDAVYAAMYGYEIDEDDYS